MKTKTTRNLLLLISILLTTAWSFGQVVSSPADSGPNSLREAVMNANANPGPDIITINVFVNPVLTSGAILITDDLTINAAGSIINASNIDRIFTITNAGSVIITNVTFINGVADNGGAIYCENTNLDINGCTFNDNTANGTPGSGGAIFNTGTGVLDINAGSFRRNTAPRAGGAIEVQSTDNLIVTGNTVFLDNTATGAPGNGGAIHITGAANSTIAARFLTNIAANEGGGIWNGTGTMSLLNCDIDGNLASGVGAANGGGGVFNNGGTLNIDAGTQLINNQANGTAGSGGGLHVRGGSAVLNGTLIMNNQAIRAGGGIEVSNGGALTMTGVILNANDAGIALGAAPGNGGGLHISGASNTIINAGTVNNNVAALEGGGLWNGTGTMTITGTTIDGNDAQGATANDGGGGIFNNGGTLTLVGNDVLISNNTASGISGSGGGIFSTNGTITIGQAVIENNSANRAGGGIELIDGTLNGTGTRLRNNDVNGGAGTPNPGNGGGLHVTGIATTNFNNSIVSGNDAASEGGGLWNQTGATMNLIATQIVNNEALGAAPDNGGGGVFNNGGSLNISTGAGPTTLINNRATGTAGSGGGLFSTNGAVVIGASTIIRDNRANRAGGGIEIIDGSLNLNDVTLNSNNAGVAPATAAPGNGGGLHISGTANTTITGGTVNGNMAAREGGGLWNNSGVMTVDNSTIQMNSVTAAMGADDGGGAIFNNGGTINLIASPILNNSASGTGASGGGILSLNGIALNIDNNLIQGNTAVRAGGGIEINGGAPVSFTGVTLDSNSVAGGTPGNGGGLHITGAIDATLTNCTVIDNMANEGGGLWNHAGNMTIIGTTITGNSALGDATGGGGIFNLGPGNVSIDVATVLTANIADGATPGGRGGAIFNNTGGTLTIPAGVTISGNYASRAGGAIEDNSGNTLVLDGVTLEGNAAGADIGLVGTVTPNPGNGGAIHLSGTTGLNISNSVVQNNQAAQEGGGLWNNTGIMDVATSIINANTANGDDATDGGGGIFNNGGTLNVDATPITNNIADGVAGSGGGIHSTSGTVTLNGTVVTDNQANRAGGGIEIAGGTLIATNVILNTNDVGVASGAPAPGNGGGLHVGGTANSTITGGTVNGNVAASEGGGLWNGSGTMVVDGTIIDNNTASGATATEGGGGLFNIGGTLTVLNATVTNNTADGASGSGGGILNDMGTLSVTDTNISGNVAMRAGGGIEVASGGGTTTLTNVDLMNNVTAAAPGNGGGMHITGSDDSTVTGGTISGNTASLEGGGLWNGSGAMTVDGTTIDNNTASGAMANEGGGGLFNAGGTLTVMNAEVNNNTADGASGSGGGILNDNGVLTVSTSNMAGNSAVRAGGAIEDNSLAGNTTTIDDVNFFLNTTGSAPGNGGGMHITGPGDSNITNGSFLNNEAALEGGGLWNGSGTMTVTGTVFDANVASGAMANEGGGAIFNAGGTLTVSGALIVNNIANGASGSGGGILNDGGVLTVSDTDIDDNTAVRAGGGIEDNSVAGNTLTLTNVNFDANQAGAAPGNGGGLHITGPGDSNITGGSATGNIAAAEGGGLWNGSGIMTIDAMNINGNTAQGNDPDHGGAGVFNNGGTLNITNGTVISNNLSTGLSGSGGGLLSTAGDVTITDSSFDGNAANRAGGAIEIIDGTLTFTNSEMINNDVDGTAGAAAPGNGGGLHVTGTSGTVDISLSTISNNAAANEGGGLWNQDGTTMNVVDSTIDTNTAAEGGGFYNNTGAITTITTSTISGNTASVSGGGITNDGASLDLNAVTVAMNNTPGNGGGIESVTSTSLKNTIVALNTAAAGMDVFGVFLSNDYNFIGTDDAGVFPAQANDIEEVDPMLGPLQNNGGVTETHELLIGSLAYNGGDPADQFDDQIGQAVFGGIRDIGAFEAQDILLSVDDVSNDSGIVIYPNPSKGQATIAIPETFGTDINVTVIELGSGKLVLQRTVSAGMNDLNFSNMQNGVYIIQLVSEGKSSTHRLILAQ